MAGHKEVVNKAECYFPLNSETVGWSLSSLRAGCGEEGSEATASRLGVMPLRPQAAVKSESWEVGV